MPQPKAAIRFTWCRAWSLVESVGWGGRDRTYECRNQNPVPYHLATPQRCKPRGAQTRASRLLAHLTINNIPQWMTRQTLRDHAAHRRRQPLQHFARRGFVLELREHAGARSRHAGTAE